MQRQKDDLYQKERDLLHIELEQKRKELSYLLLCNHCYQDKVKGIANEIESISINGTDVKTNLRQLAKKLKNEESNIKFWTKFEQEFMLAHPEFYKKISRNCSNLSSAEMKICSMIKLNISTKQISNILNITERTVHDHRLNIRKKLSLPSIQNLDLYLQGL